MNRLIAAVLTLFVVSPETNDQNPLVHPAYAVESRGRAAWRPYLTPAGGLVGGPHSFMYIVGSTLAPSFVALELPAGWRSVTGLEPTADPSIFFSPSAAILVDSPVLVGLFKSWT